MTIKAVSLKDKLSGLELDINSGNDDSFSVMHWQCAGKVEVKPDGSLVIDAPGFSKRARLFLIKAMQRNVSLVLTPEYSFPWELLDEIIDDTSLRPPQKKLWCLAMQYRTLAEFNNWYKTRNATSLMNYAKTPGSSVVVIFDGLETEKNFVNLLAYVFVNSDGSLVVLLQSKLTHMGEKLNKFEVNGLSLGDTVYLFDHGDNKSRVFCSLICADIMERDHFYKIKDTFSGRQLLLFHPQLNEKPHHHSILQPISWFTTEGWNYLRLNWSATSHIGGKPLNQLGSEYIYNSKHSQEDFLRVGSNREGYQENRKKHINLCLDSDRLGHWIFPEQEHIALYTVKQPRENSTASTVRHEFLMQKIYFCSDGDFAEAECPFVQFQSLVLSLPAPGLLVEYRNAMTSCSGTTCIKPCPLLLWDRFAALGEGCWDYELLEPDSANPAVNHCVSNLSFPHAEDRIQDKFDIFGQMADTLGRIVDTARTSSDKSVQQLQYIIPNGVKISIDDEPGQHKLSMFNVHGKDNLHKGLAVYTDKVHKNKLEHLLDNLMKKTKVDDLRVILLYPKDNDTCQIFPNSHWESANIISPSSTEASNPSFRGV